MARPRRTRRQNPDEDLRAKQRATFSGGGMETLRFLTAQHRAGALPVNPHVDTIVAFKAGPLPYLNEWAGGSNAFEFVTSTLEAAKVMFAQGGEPIVIVGPFVDYYFPHLFGADVGSDVDWLMETYADIASRARRSKP